MGGCAFEVASEQPGEEKGQMIVHKRTLLES
jgi:hypothetical protein